MKKIIFVLMIFASVSLFAANNGSKLAIGDKPGLTNIEMDDVSGAKISLSDVKKENGLLFFFRAIPVRLFCSGKGVILS